MPTHRTAADTIPSLAEEAIFSPFAVRTDPDGDDTPSPSSPSSPPTHNTGDGAAQKPCYTLSVHVQGVHCAACIHAIERILYGEEDVLNARVNMSTNRLTFIWCGTRERGDDLARLVQSLGYGLKPFDARAGGDLAGEVDYAHTLLRAVAVAGFGTGNLMMLSVALWASDAHTMGLLTQKLFHWLSALIALPVVFYAGRPFFRSAYGALKEGHANMDVPISLAVILACGMSILETLTHGDHVYFDSAVMLLFFLLIGRYLDARAKGKARESATALLSMLRGTARIVSDDGTMQTIPIRAVRAGMIAHVAAGDNIPADGTIISGETEIDMSLITGETMPQHVRTGDAVFAGTGNINAPFRMSIAKAGNKSLLSDIITLMEKAEQGQARYVRLADKMARFYTPVVHGMGLITFLGWWLWMGAAWQPSLLTAITVLIITCPCALGLAVPVVQVLASGKLMRLGIVLKSGDALEKLAHIDTVVFDKTGTLTLGKAELLYGADNRDALQLAASLGVHSNHPLSKAIVRAYGEGALLPMEQVREYAGAGLSGSRHGKEVRLGNRQWCGVPDSQEENKTGSELWLRVDGEEAAGFRFADAVRPDAVTVVRALHGAGIKTLMLSGDRRQPVADVARETGITEAHAALSPLDKCARLDELKADGAVVLMVGDGLNDAPSLATAHVSISPATAIDITQNTADITFQGNALRPVLTAWQTAKMTDILVKQNFALAVLYNIIATPLAVMGYVTPSIAAIAMSASSLVVIANSFRLNRHDNDTLEN